MSWPAALLALLVSHAAGDVLLQTDWQAINKTGGLGDPVAGRALLRHVSTYTLAFVPALVWIGAETTALRALAVGTLVIVPHLLIDDGRFVRVWLLRVKHVSKPTVGLTVAVDQSLHAVCLLGAALVGAA
jgi:hypothetical protein